MLHKLDTLKLGSSMPSSSDVRSSTVSFGRLSGARQMSNSCEIIGHTAVRIGVHARLRYLKAKKGSKRHPYETLSYSEKTKDGRWMQVVRTFDREGDWYRETVIDQATGTIVHWCQEPLTKHVGHGSANHRNVAKPRSDRSFSLYTRCKGQKVSVILIDAHARFLSVSC
jgi:hypothetical protein